MTANILLKEKQESPKSNGKANNIHYCQPQDQALLYAWYYYIAYDIISEKQKRMHLNHRRVIMLLGLIATVLAIVTALPGVEDVIVALQQLYPVMMQIVSFIRSLSLIAIPIAISSLMTYTLQFAPSLTWFVHRVGAEKIRRDIYLYRTQSEKYSRRNLSNEKRQQLLVASVDAVRAEVDNLDTLIPFQQELSEEEAQAIPLKVSNSDPKARSRGYTDDSTDDGFSPMDGVEYERQRAVHQRNWYVKRLYSDYKQLRHTRAIILTLGACGALAGALGGGWERYIVITTALITFVTVYMQLKMYGQVYSNYHRTVSKVDSAIGRWRILSDEEKQKSQNVHQFVVQVENAFQAERLKWMEQASQAMRDGEEALLKNVREWTKSGFGDPCKDDGTLFSLAAQDAALSGGEDKPENEDAESD